MKRKYKDSSSSMPIAFIFLGCALALKLSGMWQVSGLKLAWYTFLIMLIEAILSAVIEFVIELRSK